MAVRAVEKPFLVLGRIYRYKRYLNLNLQQGALYVVNIRVVESVFSSELVRRMQTMELTNIVIDGGLSLEDLRVFTEALITIPHISEPAALLAEHLTEASIHTISVNSILGSNLMDRTRQYRGDVGSDITVRTMASNLIPGDLSFLSSIESCDREILEKHFIDFHPEIIEYLLPEKVAAIPDEQFEVWLAKCVAGAQAASSQDQQQELSQKGQAVCRLLRFHSDGEAMAERLQQTLGADWLEEIHPRSSDPDKGPQIIKQDKSDTVKIMLDDLFAVDHATETEAFVEVFTRLIRTGRKDKAIIAGRELIDRMSSTDTATRQRSLTAALAVLEITETTTDNGVFADIAGYVGQKLKAGNETFEYSELVREVMDRCGRQRNYDVMADLAEAMSSRREVRDGVTVYTSTAVKRARDHLVHSQLIEGLVKEISSENSATVAKVRRILIALGGQRVATELSHIVTYPNRQVRRNVLRILGELGKASLEVFSRILMDDAMFEREPDRHELPQERWYVIRNSIYILGQLQDLSGVIPLRLRISDPDVRVRREIVSSLEKIGGEESCDLLVVMADDSDIEIAEAAIIAAGMVGGDDMSPLVADVAKGRPALAIRTVHALGQIGGVSARQCLSRWLSDPNEFEAISRGEVSRGDLRLAIVKALARIGDKEAIDRIRQFKKSLSLTQKLLPKTSMLSRTIDEILSRQ